MGPLVIPFLQEAETSNVISPGRLHQAAEKGNSSRKDQEGEILLIQLRLLMAALF